ncbi:MAG: TRAP transporter small permease subunit [Alphaproteobacteria bacterium]|nr:TRAP transporter small permease subunit [Alphaproteobacteria bacterium]
MQALRRFAAGMDGLSDRIGRALAWLVWATAAICAVVVVLRYALHETFVWMQDLYVWSHAVVFLLGTVYAMRRNAHVRVDILYAKWPVRRRALVECIGVLVFTLPWMGVLAWLTWPFIVSSWSIYEGSGQPNGMPGVFLLKTVLLVFCLLVGLQGLAVLARGILVLTGDRAAAQEPPFDDSPQS